MSGIGSRTCSRRIRSVTIVDGDREWTTARFDVADPEALVAELWAQAQESSTP